MDINGDGRRDLIVAGSTSAIYVNAGDGTFLSTPLQPLNGALDAVAALDIDQDGTNDLVAIPTAPSPDVWVLRNPGQRGPLLMQTYKLLPTRDPMQPSSLAVADLDGDCAPDVAINGSSTLLLSRKSGPVVHNIDSIRSTFGGTWLAAADVNGDGARELAWLRGTGAFFLPSAGNAQYAYPGLQPTFLDLPGGGLPFTIPGPRHLPVIDMDGDGREDLVAGVNILLNRAPLPPVSATCSPGR